MCRREWLVCTMVTFLCYLCLIIVFVTRAQSSDYKIVCYYNYWSNYHWSDGKFQVENIDPLLCTHLVYAYVGINSCSEIQILDPQLQGGLYHRGREDFKRFVELKKRNPKLKCLVGIGGYNGDHKMFSSLIMDEESRDNFIWNIKRFLNEHRFDGVSLDYYYPYEESTNDKENFISLLTEMKAFFDNDTIVAVAASGLGTKIQDYYDIPEIAKRADFVSLVTYDYHGPTWSNNKTGMIAPLYGRKLGPVDSLNQNATVQMWLRPRLGKVDSKKLLLGMPTYGRSFNLVNNRMTKVGDPTLGAANLGRYTNEPGYFTYNELVSVIFGNHKSWNEQWDDDQKVPYAYKDNLWISYENERSFEWKADYIMKMNLGGAMISSIDADDFNANSYPLIRTVVRVLSNGTVTTTTTPSQSTPSPTATVPSAFKCPYEGHFTNIEDCTEFFVCVPNPLGGFIQYTRFCPSDLGFDESLDLCHCNYRVDVAACHNPGSHVSKGCIPKEWTPFKKRTI